MLARGHPHAIKEVQLGTGSKRCISLIESNDDGTQHFNWVSMAGLYAPYLGRTTPLHHSPCGYMLSCDSPQLFHRPARVYEALASAMPELVEGLVVPIKGAAGILWALCGLLPTMTIIISTIEDSVFSSAS